MPKTKLTLKQKAAFEELLKSIKSGENADMKTIMLRAGYTELTAANPELNLLGKQAFKAKLNEINNDEIMGMFYEIMTDKNDKDARIKAGKELATLKDLYPATKSKIIGLFDKISSLEE